MVQSLLELEVYVEVVEVVFPRTMKTRSRLLLMARDCRSEFLHLLYWTALTAF